MRRVVAILFALLSVLDVAAETDALAEREARRARRVERSQRADSLARKNDRFPIFGLFRNSYIATGVATNRPISTYSSDVKFQFSFGLRLWSIADKADILFT